MPEWFDSMCRSPYHTSNYGHRGSFKRGSGIQDARKGSDHKDTYHRKLDGFNEPPPGFGSSGGNYEERW